MDIMTQHTLTIKLDAHEVADLHSGLHRIIGAIRDGDSYAEFIQRMYAVTASFLSDT